MNYSSPVQLLVSVLSRAGVRVSDDCTEQINGARRMAVGAATRGSYEPGDEDDLVPQTIPSMGRRSEATVRTGFSLRAGVRTRKEQRSKKIRPSIPAHAARTGVSLRRVEVYGWTEN
jgi:hypothetical protein